MIAITSILFPALMVAAALNDVREFKIPNKFVAILIVAWPLAAVQVGVPMADALVTIAVSALVFAMGFGLFAAGKLGAGDVKLLAAATLWVGAGQAAMFLFATTLAGAALAIFLLRFRKFPLPAFAMEHQWALEMHARQKAMPYGVAIAVGALVVWPKTAFFFF